MNRLFFYTVAISTLLLLAGATKSLAGTNPHHNHKKVVVVKPVHHNVLNPKPLHLKAGYVWVDGHWQFNRRSQKNVWIKRATIKRHNKKMWINGHWCKVKRG